MGYSNEKLPDFSSLSGKCSTLASALQCRERVHKSYIFNEWFYTLSSYIVPYVYVHEGKPRNRSKKQWRVIAGTTVQQCLYSVQPLSCVVFVVGMIVTSRKVEYVMKNLRHSAQLLLVVYFKIICALHIVFKCIRMLSINKRTRCKCGTYGIRPMRVERAMHYNQEKICKQLPKNISIVIMFLLK